MPPIKVLSQILINKIAAGEVIERPASVVKELVENSLDAGATRITVQIEDGGKKLIRITDNGSGMSSDDLELACCAHATSKLQTEDDLYAIGTLGFRGEALASIASVSQMEILSRQPSAIEGSLLQVAGGQIEPIKPAPATPGTAITVRNLFFNTPARRKFLRTTNTEMGHISEQFTRIALAHPDVHFVLEHNGRRLSDLPADQSMRQRLASLFDRELADGLISISRSEKEMKLSGMIAPPKQSRANAQYQYIFLNGRYIQDRFVRHAVKEAYRGLMEINRQPVVFLFLQVDPARVDVNVHPTKIEVRFENSNIVHSLVLATIREYLLSTDLSVAITPDTPQIPSSSDPQTQFDTDDRRDRVRQAVADFYKSVPARHVPYRSAVHTNDSPQPPTMPYEPYPSRFDPSIPPKPQEPLLEPSVLEELFTPQASQQQFPAESAPFLQIHNRFIVVQSPEGMIVIDQHALHERILYEEMFAQATSGNLESQRCLIPETVQVSDSQLATAEEAADFLTRLGIILELFGPKTLAVQGFPTILNKLDPPQFVADVLDLLIEQQNNTSSEQLLHKVLDMMACKAAVKAGDSLTDDEIKSLLARRHLVERSSNCPHGRPTTLKLSLRELEKEFKRT